MSGRTPAGRAATSDTRPLAPSLLRAASDPRVMPASRSRAPRPASLTAAGVVPAALVAFALALLATLLAPGVSGAATPLTLKPPALESPTTVYPTNTYRDLRLDPTKDYVVKMPPYPLQASYGLQISGGRNVVLVGGHIRIPWQGDRPTGHMRRALYLKDQRGTIHVEGLLLDGPDISEGINLDQRSGGKVQLANIRVVGLHARDNVKFTDTHPDVIQTWGGPTELHVDGLTGTTNYQGFFLNPTEFGSPTPRLFSFRRVNLVGAPTAGYLLWQSSPVPTRIDDVWVSPSALNTASRALSSPAYQTRTVLLPVISFMTSVPPATPLSPARAGSPRSACCTTVPDSPSTFAFCTSTSNCAALRSGSDGSALATSVPAAAPPPPMTSTAAAAGTSQRRAGRFVNADMVSTSC